MSMILNGESNFPIIFLSTSAGVPTTGLTWSITSYNASAPLVSLAMSNNEAFEVGAGLMGFSLGQWTSPPTDASLVFRVEGPDSLADADRWKAGTLEFGGELEDRFDDLDTGQTAIEAAIPNGIGKDVDGIDQDQGGVDNLRILDPGGSPVSNANIHIFLKSDWDAGNRSTSFVIANGAWSESDADGRWKYSVSLNYGTYTMIAQVPGSTQQDPVEFTVS